MYRAFVDFVREDRKLHLDFEYLAMSVIVSKVLPNVQLTLNTTNARSMSGNSTLFRCQDVHYNIFEVPSAETSDHWYHVDLEGRTCSCAKWQTTKLPCVHFFRACRNADLTPSNYIDQYDTTSHYTIQYVVRRVSCVGRRWKGIVRVSLSR